MKLSILIAAYNEAQYLGRCLDNIEKVIIPGWEKEIILVDDGSKDETLKIMQNFQKENRRTKVINLSSNIGKGGALKKALAQASGDVCLIQDADLEYDPNDYMEILSQYQDPEVMAVYGSRTLGDKIYRNYHASNMFYLGGRSLTHITNILLKTKLTDQPTGYKSWRSQFNEGMLTYAKSNGFEFEIEMTAYLSRHTNIKEVPIHYYPRTKAHGKKIGLSDFFKSVATVYRCRT